MVERASKFVLVVAGSACFMFILYQYASPGLSLGAPGGRAPPDDLDLFPTPDPHYEKKYYFPVRELERSLHFDMKGDDVIVFLHIQKTGGTTFGRHLVQNVRLEVPCDCRPGQKKCTCYRPNRRETWLFSRFSTGWSCGLHADWTELTNCVPGVLDRRDPATLRTPSLLDRLLTAGRPSPQSVCRGPLWSPRSNAPSHLVFGTSLLFPTSRRVARRLGFPGSPPPAHGLSPVMPQLCVQAGLCRRAG
ncbi:HS6ST1 [Cervus elaphus hippelaphus]|uniref:Heparan-sulfate 6-O-sulfotransferase n=1 Tax=Cervus elaphus hippelaphus TaxID=46360 RepID=A0A212C2J3_CEREH|nr:HS6ST1 [Cervus elaphus hippelaphus]